MTKLTDDSLEFAKAHIQAFYDSDFFPKPDEYNALWASWQDVKTYLMASNVERLPISVPRTMPALKSRGGYRIVHQLEPLSALVYTALVYLVAADVEAARMPVSQNVTFSYRISLTSDSFFAAGNGYSDYIEQCRKLADTHKFVLVTDITDFYNSLYLHRLNNAISHASVHLTSTAKTIEDYLSRLNNKASQGVPVGPAASIIMAEAALIDVDQLLVSRGYSHVRYVDDIRVFSNSQSELEALEEELVFYLYEAHRLQLSWQKTCVLKCEDYVSQYLQTPQRIEQRELLEVAREFSDYPDQYTEDDASALSNKFLVADNPKPIPSFLPSGLARLLKEFRAAEDAERRVVRGKALSRLLELAATSTPMDLGLARHTLRRCRSMEVPDIVENVLCYFEKLAPAIPDVFLYLHRVTNTALIQPYLDKFQALLHSPLVARSRLVRHWLYWYFSAYADFVSDPIIGRHLWNTAPIEFQARAALVTRNLAWIRSHKADLTSLGLWDRRATLLASQIMPLDERNGWLKALSSVNGNPMDKWLIDWVLTRP